MPGDLYGGADMTRLMYGRDARRVTAWAYVQQQGPGYVGLVGSSRVPQGAAHPLLYGTGRAHVLLIGELVVRPHLAIATDALEGTGAGGLYAGSHDLDEMLADGELIIGSQESLRRLRDQDGS
jgi:hypothetical protein